MSAVGTVNELLLRKLREFACLDSETTFNCLSAGESPAGSQVTLVLNLVEL